MNIGRYICTFFSVVIAVCIRTFTTLVFGLNDDTHNNNHIRRPEISVKLSRNIEPLEWSR